MVKGSFELIPSPQLPQQLNDVILYIKDNSPGGLGIIHSSHFPANSTMRHLFELFGVSLKGRYYLISLSQNTTIRDLKQPVPAGIWFIEPESSSLYRTSPLRIFGGDVKKLISDENIVKATPAQQQAYSLAEKELISKYRRKQIDEQRYSDENIVEATPTQQQAYSLAEEELISEYRRKRREQLQESVKDIELRLIILLRCLQQKFGKLSGVDATYGTVPNPNPNHLIAEIRKAINNDQCFLCQTILFSSNCPFLCSEHRNPIVATLYESLRGRGKFFEQTMTNEYEEENQDSDRHELWKREKFAYVKLDELETSKIWLKKTERTNLYPLYY